jgi:methionine-rich copper-binding protein CopC
MRCPPGCPSDTTAGLVVDGTSTHVAVPTYPGVCDRLSVPANFDGTSAMRIAPDSTGCTELIPMTCQNVPVVFSETVLDTFEQVEDLNIGSESVTFLFPEPLANDSYVLNVNLINSDDGHLEISMYGIIVTDKTVEGFSVLFSSPLDSINYKLAWSVNPEATVSGLEYFTPGSDTYRVNFGGSIGSNNYAIGTSISNQDDTNPSIYNFTIIERDENGFALQLSSPIDSTSYEFNWNVYDSTSFIPNETTQIPFGSEVFEIDIDPDEPDDQYMLSLSIINTDDTSVSIYSYMITKKNTNNFKVAFSSPIDSTNYYLSWAITYRDPELYTFRQESGFRLFDTMGRFDCTHGFDMVEINMERVSQVGVILQENDGWLLQEDAVNPILDDYGLLLD